MVHIKREVLSKIAEGNEEAFRKLYDQYHQKIFAVGYHLTKSRAVAQDITQDIFVKIWSKRNELDKVIHFDGWLKTVVRNHTYNVLAKLAKEKRIYQIPANRLPEAYVLGYDVEKKEQYEIFEKAISNLPPQQKKAFILNKREGVKIDRIAEVMSISPNTVKNHLKAASASLVAFIQKNIEVSILIAFAAERYQS